LTTAKYGQLQPSTKITVQVNTKKQTKHNKGTIRNLKGTNQYKSIYLLLDNSWRADYRQALKFKTK
jgi:hypothetical protein